MNDRELLGLAAKAAGVELQPMEVKNVSNVGDDRFIGYMVSAEKWPRGWFNPLTDDGDALRLANKLCMTVSTGPCEATASTISGSLRGFFAKESTITQPQNYATRRAIVRAAAEIGKAMP